MAVREFRFREWSEFEIRGAGEGGAVDSTTAVLSRSLSLWLAGGGRE